MRTGQHAAAAAAAFAAAVAFAAAAVVSAAAAAAAVAAAIARCLYLLVRLHAHSPAFLCASHASLRSTCFPPPTSRAAPFHPHLTPLMCDDIICIHIYICIYIYIYIHIDTHIII